MAPNRRHLRAVGLTISPVLLLVGIVNLVPALYAIYGSTREIRYYSDRGFVGLGNFISIFSDARFLDSLRLSVTFTFLCLAIALPSAFAVALMIQAMGRRGTAMMAWLLVPWALAPFAVALIWKWILTPASSGLLNGTLAFLSMGPVSLLSDQSSALGVLVGIAVWRTFAFASLVLVAGMSQIPSDLFRAASIDGATRREQIREILMPLVKPSILAAGVVLTISYFNEVQLIIGLTSGGPRSATAVLAYRLYEIGVIQFNQGLANAMSLVMLVINLLLVGVFAAIGTRIGQPRSATR